MNWLALLKEIEAGQADTLQNLQKAPSVCFVGTLDQQVRQNLVILREHQGAMVQRIRRLGDQATSVESVVDELTQRDQRKDDRHMCLECAYLHGVGNRRYCRQGRHVDALFGTDVPRDMVAILQRCRRFTHYDHAVLAIVPLS